MMHRNFGSKNFDHSPVYGYASTEPRYVSERGVTPLPEGVVGLNRRQRRLAEKTLKSVIDDAKPDTHEPYGDPNLPIANKLVEIVDSVETSQITVVSGSTGSGKSTQVPLALLNQGRASIMMQPRRLAAEMVADRIDYHVNEKRPLDSQGIVGCLTADKNTLTPNSQISIVTDGVLIRQLPGILRRKDSVDIIVDEVHEWKTETEVVLALIKHNLPSNPHLRAILMSATHDMDALNDYFKDVMAGPAPMIDIPVPIHEIEDVVKADSTVAEQAFEYGSEGKNVLCFVEGKQQIKDAIDEIKRKFNKSDNETPVVLPLHAKLSQGARNAAIASYPNGKIVVATDVAQTSITIPDIDVVVDCGRKREPHIDEEFSQSLDIVLASRADMQQRRGRCGRVKPGVYVFTKGVEEDEFVPIEDERRPDHSLPEIQRTEVDRTALYIANLGYDMSELSFVHPIDMGTIEHAKKSLRILGALDEHNRITAVGRRMEALPMSPGFARMVIESEQYSAKTRAQVVAMTVSLEAGGLQYFAQGVEKKWKELIEQNDSDMLAQLELYIAALDMDKKKQAEYNLDPQNIETAQRQYRKVMKRLGLGVDELVSPTAAEIENIKRCIYSGMIDHVYEYNGNDEYLKAGGVQIGADIESSTPREISNRSVVDGRPSMIVGYPYRYTYMAKGELVPKHIVEKVSRVSTPAVLGEIASSLCVWRPVDLLLRGGRLVQRETQFYRNTELGVHREVEAGETDDAVSYLVNHVMNNAGSALRELRGIESTLKELRKLSPHAPKSIQGTIDSIVLDAVKASGLDESYADQLIRERMYQDNITLHSYITEEEIAEIHRNSPPVLNWFGQEFAITYEHGQPLIKRYNIASVAQLENELRLDDGRKIKFVGERGKYFSLRDLKRHSTY